MKNKCGDIMENPVNGSYWRQYKMGDYRKKLKNIECKEMETNKKKWKRNLKQMKDKEIKMVSGKEKIKKF